MRPSSLAGPLAGVLVLVSACRTAAPPAVIPADRLAEGVATLTRPLTGDLGALYKLRVGSTGGLRLSVLAAGDAGRFTVSEPFGAAVSLAAWSPTGPAILFDLREGCRLTAPDVSAVLGLGRLPLPEAARLLAGRLPALPDDTVVAVPGVNQVMVTGNGWACRVDLAENPWRVVGVAGEGWKIELDRHTGALPGRLELRHQDGRSAELVLVRVEWAIDRQLPAEPDLPACPARDEGPT